MGHDDGHWLQTDERWAGREYFIRSLEFATARLAIEVQHLMDGARSGKALRRALKLLSKEVRNFATNPVRSRPTAIGSLGQSGCYLLSFSNLLRHLRVDLGGEEPNPNVLLRHLQYELLLTPTGYSAVPGFDLLNLVTEGEVSLIRAEDFGRRGVAPIKSEILRTGLKRGHAAILNVVRHEHFSNSRRNYTHYVLVIKRAGRNWIMHDPYVKGEIFLAPSYRRVFQVFQYRRKPSRRKGRG